MQFPVPQFTEIEDKIIGPLTVKQFGILFGAGVLVFLAYTASGKNLIVGIFFLILFGLPALGIAFAKINGRPLYNAFGFLVQHITSPKVYVFHKEIVTTGGSVNLKNAQMSSKSGEGKPAEPTVSPQERLRQVSELLQKQAEEEKELIGRI
jgi:hypothetical protein